MKKKIIITSICILAAAAFVLLFYTGIIRINGLEAQKYEVVGVDVSSHQGDISWDELKEQSVSFAYIKATEGSSFVDENFAENLEKARKSGVAAGAYHFFSYDSSGEAQADNFIKTVPKKDDMLIPAADVEFYGKYEKTPAERGFVRRELSAFLEKLEDYYGKKPVIYATMRSYELYIKEDFRDYPLWIRDVYFCPNESMGWSFWQYSDKGRLTGFSGRERFIDMNVFYSDKKALDEFLIG